MRARDILLAADGRKLALEEGDEDVVRVLPPLDSARVAEIEARIGVALPAELKEILAATSGLDADVAERLDLAKIDRCGMEELFGWVIELAGDGRGNSWILELRPGMTTLGPIWFLDHDPPVLAYQCDDLATFVESWLVHGSYPHEGPLVEVSERHTGTIWDQTSDVPRDELVRSNDPVLRDFAARLDSKWFIADLRRATLGQGMPIGRYGPKTPLARAGTEHVFAYATRTRGERFKTWLTGR